MDGGREGGRERGRERWRERGREVEREGEREGGREKAWEKAWEKPKNDWLDYHNGGKYCVDIKVKVTTFEHVLPELILRGGPTVMSGVEPLKNLFESLCRLCLG